MGGRNQQVYFERKGAGSIEPRNVPLPLLLFILLATVIAWVVSLDVTER